MDIEYTRKGQGNLNTVLGAIGTAGAVGLMNGNGGGILGNLFGGNCNYNCNSDSMPVTRYDMGLIQSNNALASENSLLKADKYTDQKFADLNDRYSARFTNIEAQLAAQAVHNAKVEGSFALAEADLRAAKSELYGAIRNEAEKRCCGDNAIVTYANATFYPKMVADVTTGTTTTAQMTYNPIPDCGTCCNK